jgi:chemosensory pili system protein ChpA (sensor histidine kinase/response regulator)
VLEVTDDGIGIQSQSIVARAHGMGWDVQQEELGQADVLRLIFLPGFSTRDSVDTLSGRGVGLDIVQAAATRLKGRLTVESTPGYGTTFRLRLPVVLAVTQAHLVRAGAQRYAIPVDNVVRVVPDDADRKRRFVNVDHERLPIVDLSAHLTGRDAAHDMPGAALLIVRTAHERWAVRVDELDGPVEIVVKPLGRLLRKMPGLIGATLLDDREVGLVLDVAHLATPALLTDRAGDLDDMDARSSDSEDSTQARVVLVVDDSLSVRRVLGRTLERHGWETLQARDGIEALELLAAGRVDIVVADIEMPRMDGLELVAAIRSQQETAALPVVVLTSRASDKHRQRAYEIGASAYLVKPFQEEELISVLDQALADA